MLRKATPRALLLTALLALVPSQASGFCRTRTCDTAQRLKAGLPPCETDERGCVTEGHFLHWRDGATSMVVDAEGSVARDITGEQTLALVVEAFAAWERADCGGGEPPDMRVSIDGLVSGQVAEFDERVGARNENLVIYDDFAWPYDESAVAITTMTYDRRNGRIVDADTELNTALHPLAVDATGSDVDLLAVLTHEVGHVLGLSHTDVPGATMQAEASGASFFELRSLEDDDQAGICAIYAPSDGGCACRIADRSASHRTAGGSALLLSGVLGAAFWRRRTRRR